MLSFITLFVLSGFYFWSGEDNPSRREAYWAMAVYGIYIVIHTLVPPFPIGTSSHFGQLYGFLPMISFGAILFPHFNSHSPETVTKTLGWLGLITVTVILLIFKCFVW
ncbi:hypothetical protein ABT56_15930 [Photobacterium aquae]|uniref:Uncharacterized protein n=1 Tax=Photobacterium aquae TaxID=1195763 RepID=A0A0J1GXD1_9GAMM|nr:hypothetical protein [Photobacterium aquae]KLV04099.1 hypothetical protein ABT56_15930 [Photobacterium aquae]